MSPLFIVDLRATVLDDDQYVLLKDSLPTLSQCVRGIFFSLRTYLQKGSSGWSLLQLHAQGCTDLGFEVYIDDGGMVLPESIDMYVSLYTHSWVKGFSVSPFAGIAPIRELTERLSAESKQLLLVLRTENEGSSDVQEVPVGDQALFEHLAESLVQETPQTLAFFLSTSYPEEIAYIRSVVLDHELFISLSSLQIPDLIRGARIDGTGISILIDPSKLSDCILLQKQFELGIIHRQEYLRSPKE